jgi:DNA helicase-2/ATP-dependent DNA helicase PcrA
LKFIADLHIHSRFSRATARSLDLPHLDYWGGRKGIKVVATGDAVHPGWLEELNQQLDAAEPGLYRLKPELAMDGGGDARFIISTEISSIYKKNDRVRKIHSLILLSSLEAAEKLAEKLDAIGNIKSDGRPILGLDAKDLLAVCLDVDPDCFFIPAHIWTPWFSLFGSKSGFDDLEECFEDLSPHIHALETGLSSDPLMNWRLSQLDRFTLVSNSDAHSPDKLGREANVFDTELSYDAMVNAMMGKGGFAGTLEFFPEEGKYHLDGHRKCEVRLEPEETTKLKGLCPKCGKPVTEGVLGRVVELADQPMGRKPDNAPGFESLIPLTEILGEILNVGPKSKKVSTAYEKLLNDLGPELFILREAPLEDVSSVGGRLLAEGLGRMRQGKVRAEGGYDGEFGRIGLFEPGELDRLAGQADLFPMGSPGRKRTKPEKTRTAKDYVKPEKTSDPNPAQTSTALLLAASDGLIDDLNDEQRSAVTASPGPLCILAGPGTGKTLVLTRRAAWLIREGLARPENVYAVTFTRQAANEMSARLNALLPFRPEAQKSRVSTFHALGLRILTEHLSREIKILDEDERLQAVRQAADGSGFKAPDLLNRISLIKQGLAGPGTIDDTALAAAFTRYENILAESEAMDFDDMVVRAVRLLEENADVLEQWRNRIQHLLVDEYQDVNLAQYRLTRLLAAGNNPDFTVIGDPDQAIYGFRGADSAFFQQFQDDFPKAKIVALTENYRNSDTIIKAAAGTIHQNPAANRPKLKPNRRGAAKVATAVLATPAAEAEYVVWRIEQLLGGASHFALDSGRVENHRTGDLSLGDIAILYRLHQMADPIVEALHRAGLPIQQAGVETGKETDSLDFTAERISLLTMHAAKGLEFEVVFVIGLEEGIVPYEPPNKAPADISEERRLFFVALTRARRELVLTRSRKRTLFGQKRMPEPSPFLAEIASGLKALEDLPGRKAKPRDRQMDLF